MPANDDGDILGLAVTKKRKPETPSQNESKKKGKASSTHEKKIPVLDNGWLPPIDKLSKQEFCRYSSWKKTVICPSVVSKVVKKYSGCKFEGFKPLGISVIAEATKCFIGNLIENAVMNSI